VDDVLVVGEALVDIVQRVDGSVAEHPGGSPTNVAFGLARLGRPTRLLTRIGDDARGAEVRRHLESSGVRLVPGSLTSEPTSTATARLDALGVATYEFDLDWRLPAQVDVGEFAALHTGSIAAALAPGREAVLDLVTRTAGRATGSFDPNARPALMGDAASAREGVERFVAASDVVKVSEEDLDWLAPGEALPDLVQQWLGLGPSVVVVTRGGEGAGGLTATGWAEVPAPRIAVVDTVGAGDAFMSGLLDFLAGADLLGTARRDALRAMDGPTLSGMLQHAVRVAAFTCTRPGAQPPTRAELDAWTP
jgi:fructokinase